MSKKDLPPPPETSVSDALSRRFSIGGNEPQQQVETPIPAHTQVQTAQLTHTRPDPAGMRRASFYVTAEAAAQLEAAADQILAVLGQDTPRHVALSALMHAGAAQAGHVAQQLAKQAAADLAARIARLSPPA